MKRETIGYKVVRQRERYGTRSLVSGAVYDSDWIVAYAPGFPSYGRGGSPLFAFDSLPHARAFAREQPLNRCQVWKANLRRPKVRKRLASWVYNYLSFWAGRRRNTFQAPAGTLACEAITLLAMEE